LYYGLFEVAGFVAALFEGGDFGVYVGEDGGDRR
jgi:ascorbate-specific PTS system EIIC-type component UlaA